MNNFMAIGNLVTDPETRTVTTKNGPIEVTNFRFACNGRDRTKTTFMRVTAWGNAGNTIKQYAKTGSKMMLTGEVSTSAFINTKTREPQATLELTVEKFEFLSSSGSAPVAKSDPAPKAEYIPDKPVEPEEELTDNMDDDDLPF